MQSFLDRLKLLTIAALLFSILTTFGPGVLLLYTFKYNVFAQVDNLRLILLAGSITIPVFFLNSSTVFLVYKKLGLSTNALFETIGFIASIFTMSILYLPLLVNFCTPKKTNHCCHTIYTGPAISNHDAMMWIILPELIISLIAILYLYKYLKEIKAKLKLLTNKVKD